MKADTKSPAEIFGYHIRYVVPLFQRPYVWIEQDQWAALWDDVADRASEVNLTDERVRFVRGGG